MPVIVQVYFCCPISKEKSCKFLAAPEIYFTASLSISLNLGLIGMVDILTFENPRIWGEVLSPKKKKEKNLVVVLILVGIFVDGNLGLLLT